jgi:competence protein ComEC
MGHPVMGRDALPFAVVCFVAGLVAGSWFCVPPWPLSLLAFTLVLILLVRPQVGGYVRLTWVILALLFGVLGAFHAHRLIPHGFPANHLVHLATGKMVDLEGVVLSTPKITADRTRFRLGNVRVYGRRGAVARHGAALITVEGDQTSIAYGDKLRFRCRLRIPEPQGNPGAFSWKRHLALQKIFVTGFVRDPRSILRLRRRQGNRLRSFVEGIRRRLATLFRQEFASPARELLLALVVGESWAVDNEWRETFAGLGVAHLLAISGLHLGILTLVGYCLSRRLLLWIPGVAVRVSVDKVAWGPTILLLVAYAGIAGMGTATLRALIMIVCLSMAFVLDRRRGLYHGVALAALIILLIQPAALYGLSFEFSFLAVLGIVYAVPKWREAMKRDDPPVSLQPQGRVRRCLDRILLLAMCSTAALLATLPVAILHFHRLPLGALPANLLLIPLVGLLILPVVLAGSALFLFLPDAGMAILRVGAWMLQQSAFGLKYGAGLLGTGWYLPEIRPWEVVLFYAACVGTCHLHRRRWAKWMTLAPILLLVGLWQGERCLRSLTKEIRLHCLSVGNGLAILIEGPGSASMLVDGGGTYDQRNDIGALLVAPVLWHRRLSRLDRVIATHPHPDHIGGLPYILKTFGIGSLWGNGDRPAVFCLQRLDDAARKRGCRLQILRGGDVWQVGEAKVEVLHPPEPLPSLGKGRGSRTNNRSVVLRIVYGDVSFLLPGDIESEAEALLVLQDGLRSTVLIAPHHGSSSSSTKGFLDAVSPRYAVFSSRAESRRGVVDLEILQRYRERGVQVFTTGEDGMVTFTTDGRRLRVDTYLSHRSEEIKVSGEPLDKFDSRSHVQKEIP